MGDKNRYHLDDGGRRRAGRALIDAEPRTRGFGNARFVRNVFEAAVGRQAERLPTVEHPTDEQLTTLTADDIASPTPDDRLGTEVVHRAVRLRLGAACAGGPRGGAAGLRVGAAVEQDAASPRTPA